MPRRRSGGDRSLLPATDPATSRRRRLVLVTAPVVTALVIGTAVVTSGSGDPSTPSVATADAGSASLATLTAGLAPKADPEIRTLGTSRSAARVPLVDNRLPEAKGKLWTTAVLRLRVRPVAKSEDVGLLESDRRVPVTGRKKGGYAEVIDKGVARWVTADYLSKEKKKVAPTRSASVAQSSRSTTSTQSGRSTTSTQTGSASRGLVDSSCPATAGTENGLSSSAVRVYRAVCNNFPEITSYGGYAARGEHGSGRAIDIMTSDSGLGDRIADFLKANAGSLNLFDVIWRQRIWTPVRASEGWRSMSSRGSATANHFDHVHVAVN